MTVASYLVHRRSAKERERETKVCARGEENTLLTSLLSSVPSNARLRPGKGGEQTRALPLSSPKRKVSCVIKQRGRNVSSVQERPYCPHREATRVDGGDGGIAAPARIEARRVATGEDGRVKRPAHHRRIEEKEEEDRDAGRRVEGQKKTMGGARGEGVMICRPG